MRNATIARLAMRFCRMMRLVARLSRTANGTRPRSSLISAMSQVSNATVEPAAPIAMPTSARAIAGASLTPSPTIAIGRWVSARRVI